MQGEIPLRVEGDRRMLAPADVEYALARLEQAR